MDINWTIAAAAAAWAIILGGAGGALTEIGPWYRGLKKPSWQPPDWLFGPAWTIILGLSAWSLYRAWVQSDVVIEHILLTILFGVNFVLHLAWSPLFFKAKRPDWALVENVFLWTSVAALCFFLSAYNGITAWLNVPYLLWVSFAFVLNWKVVQLNRPFGASPNQA